MKRAVARLGSVSAVALLASGAFGLTAAEACDATAQTVNTGTVTTSSVDVVCNTAVDTQSFDTGFAAFTDTVTSLSYDAYDGSGDDTLNLSDGTISGTSPNPPPRLTNTDPGYNAYLNPQTAFVSMGAGNDVVLVTGGTLVGDLLLSDGNDTANIIGGTIIGSVFGDDTLAGDDTITIGGGATIASISGTVYGGAGTDSIFVQSNAQIGTAIGQVDSVGLEDGDDFFDMNGGTLTGGVSGGNGNDTMSLSGGSVNFVAGGIGNDVITVSGTVSISDVITAEDGDDTVTMSGGTVGDVVDLGPGTDSFTMSGGTVGNGVFGGTGNDTITISGGTVTGDIIGDAGTDVVNVSGGTINGSIDAETVRLYGGTITGDITGISATTLVIQSGTALTLRDGVLFQGTNAVGTITNSDLARSTGNGAFQSQTFNGFNTLGLDGSTLGFTTNQSIAALSLTNGSTLFSAGQVNLLSPAGGAGSLSVTNSAINLINGSTADRLSVGNLSLNTATIGIDVNQVTAQADQILASGTFNATGANVVLVNLVGTPQFGTVTIIPIAPIAGEAAPTGGTSSALFSVAGIPQNASALFAYDVITGANGGLYLRARGSDFLTPMATHVAIDSASLENATRNLLDISNDAIVTELGLANSANRSDAAPAFGIYASGQLAHVNHDGFDISGAGITGVGPSFSSNDFSVAASVELDAAKYWGFDNQYGLNLGLFGGYASTDVTVDPTTLFANVGNANNDAGMIGGYGLFRQGVNYGLVAVTGFFGQTDINNSVLNSTGGYDTAGYAVTGSAGHIFALGDHLRFDLRGGLLGAFFEGDPYTDSIGVNFGRSRISFGAIKFEPGIYGDFKLDNGMTVSPYARMELQQRFGYRNTGSIQGIKLNFDDADFSAAFSGGVNVQVAKSTTLSGEVRTKLSADSNTIAGKLGLKVKF